MENFLADKLKNRNKSKLSYADCSRILHDRNISLEEISNADLDALYFVAFKSWAYYFTTEAYIKALKKYRTNNVIN